MSRHDGPKTGGHGTTNTERLGQRQARPQTRGGQGTNSPNTQQLNQTPPNNDNHLYKGGCLGTSPLNRRRTNNLAPAPRPPPSSGGAHPATNGVNCCVPQPWMLPAHTHTVTHPPAHRQSLWFLCRCGSCVLLCVSLCRCCAGHAAFVPLAPCGVSLSCPCAWLLVRCSSGFGSWSRRCWSLCCRIRCIVRRVTVVRWRWRCMGLFVPRFCGAFVTLVHCAFPKSSSAYPAQPIGPFTKSEALFSNCGPPSVAYVRTLSNPPGFLRLKPRKPRFLYAPLNRGPLGNRTASLHELSKISCPPASIRGA